MHAPNRIAVVIPAPRPAPAPFSSVRASRDLTLAAFGAALLSAFALQAGAFLPPLEARPGAGIVARVAAAEARAAPPVEEVAARAVRVRAAHRATGPCASPRG